MLKIYKNNLKMNIHFVVFASNPDRTSVDLRAFVFYVYNNCQTTQTFVCNIHKHTDVHQYDGPYDPEKTNQK